MEFYRKKTKLSDLEISGIITDVKKLYLKAAGKRALDEMKFSFAFEEMLVKFKEQYGTERETEIVFGKRFRGLYIELSQRGAQIPWTVADEDDAAYSYDILSGLGVYPRYYYSSSHGGVNRLVWESLLTPKSPSVLRTMLISVVLAVIVGVLIGYLPQGTHDIIVNDVVSLVFTKLTMIFSALATPLVFFAVISGIVGIGDVKSFGKIGSKVLGRMAKSYALAAVLTGIGCGAAYGLTFTESAAEGEASAVGKIVQLVLDIVPDNLIAPFSIDNDLQVIVIAIFIGVTLLMLGSKATRIVELVKDFGDLVNKMMMLCTKLLPFVVFFGVVKIISTSNSKQFISIAKMLLVYLAVNAVFMLTMILRARISVKVPLKKIIPKQLQTLMINITTSSQVAALPENIKCCRDKFGIDSKLVNFALPLGIVVYMPSGAIFIGVAAWSSLAALSMTASVSVMIRLLIVSVILAIAAPPIPGSAIVVLPVIFTSCGISNEAFPLAVIFATIIGYILPAANGFNIQLELLMTAKKLKKIDEEKLNKVFAG